MDGLPSRAAGVLKAVQGDTVSADAFERSKYDAMIAMGDLPRAAGRLLYWLRTRGVAVRLHHHGLQDLERHIDRSSNRVALALVTLGLYIASSC
jgi:ubiquinone biosynthesis protein